MNMNEMFPSNYLKAADINQDARVTILRVNVEQLGDDHKPVIYFNEFEKGMVLNKTNATNISDIYGPDTDRWGGQPMTLTTAWVDFQGKSTKGLRLYPPATSNAPAPAGQQYDERNPPPATGNEYATASS